MALLYASGGIFTIFLAIFGVRLMRSGTILVFPRMSRTYRILAKYGDPARLIKECEASFGESRKHLESREHVCIKGFVIYPTSSSVFIAPISALARAHVTKVSDDIDGPGTGRYAMVLFFTKKVRISYRVSDKAEGVGELKWMKRQNPDMHIGFNLRGGGGE